MGWGGARAAVKNSKHSKALKLQPPLGIKCRVSWLVLIDHPLSDGLSLPSGKAAVCRLLARRGDNRGGTDFLPLLPPLLLLLHLSALPLPSPPPSLHPSSPSRSPPPQSQAGTRSSTHQHQLQKRGFFPSGADSLGGGVKKLNSKKYVYYCVLHHHFFSGAFLFP